MSLTVKNLIDRYSKLSTVTESESVDFKLEGVHAELELEETKVLAALNMGVVTEKIIAARRIARAAGQ